MRVSAPAPPPMAMCFLAERRRLRDGLSLSAGTATTQSTKQTPHSEPAGLSSYHSSSGPESKLQAVTVSTSPFERRVPLWTSLSPRR